MTLSWTGIQSNAARFAADFAAARNERAEAQTFWNRFFELFGIERRRVAVFESKVHKLNKNPRFMDLFWPGVLLVEHKSAGQNLALAHGQATDYFLRLKDGEHPRFVLVCDFQNFWLRDLDEGVEQRFQLHELPTKVSLFGFLRGQQTSRVRPDDPINDQAVQKLSRLHQALRADGYTGRALQLLMVRLLICLFADKTGLFEPAGNFTDLVENASKPDGSDLGPVLIQLFDQLDTEFSHRQKSSPGWFSQYPYVNGRLFEEKTRIPALNAAMSELLLDCCHTDWSRISPAIFGSMFQHIMDGQGADTDTDLRRELGAHYTSEDNILKAIGPLFLDDLRAEFLRIKTSQNKLFDFQKKLRTLQFLDPACGCGNFLVITYRELRLLELDVLRAVQSFGTRIADPFKAILVNVDQFYGIEIEEFPARVAQVAMWLVDHQMNMQASQVFAHWLPRLPLLHSATIRIGNALDLDWADLCPPERLSFIVGNPPFIGKQNQSAVQKIDMDRVLAGTNIQGGGVLDYVAAWYIKAAQYLVGDGAAVANERKAQFKQALFSQARTVSFLDDGLPAGADAGKKKGRKGKAAVVSDSAGARASQPSNADTAPGTIAALQAANDIFELQEQQNQAARERIGVAFVSTNSICQGEQVGVLWGWLLKEGIRIAFAHRTFKWSNEAGGQAAVHCVIVGFGLAQRVEKLTSRRLFDYPQVDGPAVEGPAARINPYLVDAPDVVLGSRREPLAAPTALVYGSFALDDGHFTLSVDDRARVLAQDPKAEKFLRPFIGGQEMLHNQQRWCVWLEGVQADELRRCKPIYQRVEAVRQWRELSGRDTTRKLAQTPTLFAEVRQSGSACIAIPTVSSERRAFIPMAFLQPEVVGSNQLYLLPHATSYHFGILSSTMHNAWVRYTCGRLESRYRYSAGIVYNNFPWPPALATVTAEGLTPNKPPALLLPAQAAIENAANAVLAARAAHPNASLAVLYDPATMPPELVQAHRALDAAVDAAYVLAMNPKPKFKTDAQRVAFLFGLYEKLVQAVAAHDKPREAVALADVQPRT